METMDASDEARADRFLRAEAGLLNDERYDDWLALLTDDFVYTVPMPVLRDDPRKPRYSEVSVLAWESVTSLRYRFERISMEFAWADRPPAFHRRHITAVRPAAAGEASPSGELAVRSDVLVARTRAPESTEIISACRDDVLREEDGRLKLARRTVYLDTDRPALPQIAVLF